MEDADLFIAERLIEGAQAEAMDGIALLLSHRIRTQDKETPTARSNCRTCLKLCEHAQTLSIPDGADWR